MEKQKVVLYNPRSVFYTMPLALVAIASNLDPERFEVKIIDARLEKDPHGKLISESKNALCIGFTVLTGDPIRDALAGSRLIKSNYPELPVIWGGWHPSLLPGQTLEEESIDIVVRGQGEETFSDIVDALSENQNLNIIDGISFKSGGLTIENKERNLKDINDFPFQDYGLIDVQGYYKFKKQKQFDYISSTGCFFRCAFCADPYVFKRKWTALEPERMGEEIEQLWHKYKFTELAFQDETFFTYKERVIEIAEQFLKRGLKFKWTATMRADQGERLGEDVIKLLVKSGLRWVLIGVESGSNEMLEKIKKDITVEQILFCAEFCKRYGIYVNFPSIVGFPGESDESVSATLNLVNKLRQMSPNFVTPIFFFKPYPGSYLTFEAVEKGYNLPQSLYEWADFDYVGSSGPWVDKKKYKLIEDFKFYNRMSGGREIMLKKPFQKIARWRLKNKNYNLPVEKYFINLVKPQPRLS